MTGPSPDNGHKAIKAPGRVGVGSAALQVGPHGWDFFFFLIFQPSWW